MASSTRSILDRVYLVYFVIHIPILFCVDLVPLYPQSLWVPSASPLHILFQLREYYITTYNDQFFQPPPAPIPSFFPLYAFLELVFHLPVSLWAVRALGTGGGGGAGGAAVRVRRAAAPRVRRRDGPHDRHLHVRHLPLGPGRRDRGAEDAVLLTIDMYARVLKRLNAADAVKKGQ
ncbi:hypothetical protein CIB48_g9768 [Xylaria polymorpha]|nr:hypothetical protein CIB48_g9768 [Xylaria polymorpha]